jgi:hypothetical protein
MPSPLSEHSIPFRWPTAWADARHLSLLKGSPVDCVLEAPNVVAEAARAQGMLAVTRDEAAQAMQFLPRPVWPGIRVSRQRNATEAGPTGAAWVNANGWAIQLAQATNPGKPVWVEAAPAEGSVQSDASYLLAIAEPAVYNARWMLTLDGAFASGLAAGDAALQDRWKKITAALRFFEERQAWARMEPRTSFAVVSAFAGNFEKEFLNLADRRNLAYRIVPKRDAARGLIGPFQAVLYLDRQPPDAGLSGTLKQVARDGALLIAPFGSGVLQWGDQPLESAIPNYEVKSLGKGRVAVARKAWADPYVVAAEARILIGRRSDVLRVFNAGSMSALYARSKDGSKGVVHMLNYTLRTASHPVAVAPVDKYQRAQVVMLDRAVEGPDVATAEKNFAEIPVPPFTVYSAIQLLGSREG